ncbi:serine protease snake-like [Ischnura elegans]|uniref:serine protease snake-like n=1 Tax=Ischnura elegans TaxID=197161 RepID=UPI001ED86AF3|nr:serine protease snake-like [Ischnura elegans]
MEMKTCTKALLLLSIIAAVSAQRYPGDRCTDSRRRNGVCTPLNQCPSAQQDLRQGVRPTNCGFQGGQPVVCCVAQSQRPQATRPSGTPPRPSPVVAPVVAPVRATKPGEKAKKWCDEYNKACPVIFGVVGGTPALPDEFPHMAAIGYGPQNNIEWKCGGSLIAENFVLTAAHCLRGGNAGVAQWVLLGTVDLVPNEAQLGDAGQIHRVIRRIRHPEYKPPAKYNDVALLEIGPAITKNPKNLTSEQLHPACLRLDDSTKYDSYIATGWGRVGPGEDPSNQLLKVALNVFDEAKCNETFETEIRTTTQLRRGIDSTMLCAGILSGGKDTCQGDSGGPLMYATYRTCMYEIWGVTSFGKVCSFANSPSVYTKVSAFVEWIENIVWPN